MATNLAIDEALLQAAGKIDVDPDYDYSQQRRRDSVVSSLTRRAGVHQLEAQKACCVITLQHLLAPTGARGPAP